MFVNFVFLLFKEIMCLKYYVKLNLYPKYNINTYESRISFLHVCCRIARYLSLITQQQYLLTTARTAALYSALLSPGM